MPNKSKKEKKLARAKRNIERIQSNIQVEEPPRRASEKSFFVVGIGASAGGLEGFERFFANMPSDSGMAFVLIPHLDPKHKSMLGDLLRRYTDMKVYEAEEKMEVRPNSIYIIPPNKDMAIINTRLHLLEPKVVGGIRHPIDFFFRSLAEDFKEKAICIIFSGTGTEGTLGLKSIKGEGGLVMAQEDPVYNGMPQSAISTGLVDYVLPAAKMAVQLLRYTRRLALPVKEPAKAEEKGADNLQKILGLIRMRTGHDFSLYKPNTIIRRVERRMAVHQIEKMTDYIHFLRMNPQELDVLFTELLIRVTNFFRDPEAFDVLKKTVLPMLFKGKPEDYALRVWVPGCSTGEEAYSLAMLMNEFIQQRRKRYKVQIFATDIDHGAIETARTGIYPESVTVDVTAQRLDRYFIKKGNTYKVKNEIREMVVFAIQNLIKDPPFSKVDLISCRNLLIYLGPELQKRILPTFQYALNPGGILFLGSSETVGSFGDIFRVLDKKWKIYQSRRSEAVMPPFNMEARQFPYQPLAAVEEKRAEPLRPTEPTIRDMLEPLLLNEYTPAAVVTSENGDILFIHGRTGRFLEPATGRASLNVLEMAREGLKLDLRGGLRKAARLKKDLFIEGVSVKSNGGFFRVNLEIKPVRKPESLQGMVLIIFHEIQPLKEFKPVELKGLQEGRYRERCSELEMELKSSRERLQTTIEELETSNEELKSANEELQSSNEELQSTNEELETSREELQSVNEELVTVNTELQTKVDELAQLNADMNNLMASTQIAMIFLDKHLKIKRFTPAVLKAVNLIESDVGRPLGDIATKLDYPDLIKDAAEVLKTLAPKEKTISHKGGHWFLVRIMPYRTVEDVIDGVVLTLVDITELKCAREEVESALEFAESIIDSARESMLLFDEDLRVIKANKSFYEKFHGNKKKVDGKHLSDLNRGQWNIPHLKKELDRLLARGVPVREFRLDYRLHGGGKKPVYINAVRLLSKARKEKSVLMTIEEVEHESGDGKAK